MYKMPVKMTITKSDKVGKKYKAVFSHVVDGKRKVKRTTYFGSAGMTDYLISKEKDRRTRYRSRHRKDLNTKDPMRAGYLSWYLLWGDSTSMRENIKKYKSRFNFT